MGYKVYSDSYLMSMTKAQIIALLRVAEHNSIVTEEALNISANAGMDIAEKYDKAKEILKSAVKIAEVTRCDAGGHICSECEYYSKCDNWFQFEWKLMADAKKLIGDEIDA